MLKAQFIRALSIGVHPGLNESKKLSIQIATLDAYWSLLTISFYLILGLSRNFHPLLISHLFSLIIIVTGLWLLYKHHYDSARFMIHFICLVEVFLTADAYGVNSGVENFYFTSIAIPFVTFSIEERWKGNIQVAMASLVLIFQQLVGTGYWMPPMEILPGDKIVSILIVISYFLVIFGVVRRHVRLAQVDVFDKQKELIHSSKMIALGEMSASIAHEINNPLQSLSLQTTIVKEKISEDEVNLEVLKDHLSKMEVTISKVGKLIQGLKDLSEDRSHTSIEKFQFVQVLDNVLHSSAERLGAHGAKLFINGDTSLEVRGHSSQIGDVLLKLIHDANEAVRNEQEKWIRIEISEKNSFLQVSVSNSGKNEVCEKKGHNLKHVIEKSNGTLYHDVTASYSRFVMLLPLG